MNDIYVNGKFLKRGDAFEDEEPVRWACAKELEKTVIDVFEQAHTGTTLRRAVTVHNGTTNFIWTQMVNGDIVQTFTTRELLKELSLDK